VLRILVPSDSLVEQLSPLKRDTHRYELELVKNFARKHLLVPAFEPIDRWDDLIPTLLSGKGHIIAANLRVTESRKSRVAFTEPINTMREHLLVRAGDDIDSPSDLEAREIAVREGSSFWDLIQDVRKEYPKIQVRIVPEYTTQQSLYEGVHQGRFDMAAVDLYAFQQKQEDWADLKLVPHIFEDDIIAWGTHPKAQLLREKLNRFIRKAELARQPQSIYKADLRGIKERKVLRVLTRNNAVTYFIWRGRLMGFEYELMRKFAREQDLQLEMIIAPSREHLIPMLLWGGGDLISASLTVTDQRRTYGIDFSNPYNLVSEVVVARADDTELNHVTQLEGRTIWVRRSSSYWTTLERLRLKGHIRFILKAAPESMETEEIIDKVASGEYDLTVSDSHILDVALTWRDDVRAAFTIKEKVKHGWAVRKEDQELLQALNAFLEREYRKSFYNVTHRKYFKNPRRIQQLVKFRADGGNGGELSPYDDLVQKYAEIYGFDWPLIVALMYHESRFKKDAVSWAGARGLMQVLPVTAKRFGISDLEDPEKSIIAGMKMLNWLYDQFELELPVQERTWFTLASYNAGLGHVYDARELAKEMNLDPNRWFENVEVAMLKLSKPEYYSDATYGYVRGIEPVTYVRNIRKLYTAYIELLREPLAANYLSDR
jgi:membrane-bound lytic murein transglycosylase F